MAALAYAYEVDGGRPLWRVFHLTGQHEDVIGVVVIGAPDPSGPGWTFQARSPDGMATFDGTSIDSCMSLLHLRAHASERSGG